MVLGKKRLLKELKKVVALSLLIRNNVPLHLYKRLLYLALRLDAPLSLNSHHRKKSFVFVHHKNGQISFFAWSTLPCPTAAELEGPEVGGGGGGFNSHFPAQILPKAQFLAQFLQQIPFAVPQIPSASCFCFFVFLALSFSFIFPRPESLVTG